LLAAVAANAGHLTKADRQGLPELASKFIQSETVARYRIRYGRIRQTTQRHLGRTGRHALVRARPANQA
jgi:hypothetical protein